MSKAAHSSNSRPTDESDVKARADAILAQLRQKYPTEKDCWEYIVQAGVKAGVIQGCRSCKGERINRRYGARTARCSTCRKKIWLLADTFFADIKKVFPYLAAISLIEHGIAISNNTFSKLLGIAYSSAWLIAKKLAFVAHEQMQAEGLEIATSLMAATFIRRNCETPARCHPSVEDDEPRQEGEAHDEKPASESNSQTEVHAPAQDYTDASLGEVSPETQPLGERESSIYGLISSEPTSFNELLSQLGGNSARNRPPIPLMSGHPIR